MTLCILPQTTTGDGTTFRLEGWLTEDSAAELRRACGAAHTPVALDIAHLIHADPDGVETLMRLREEGVRFLNPSPYLALLLGLRDPQA